MIHRYLLLQKFTLTHFMDLNYLLKIQLLTLTVMNVILLTVMLAIDVPVLCLNNVSFTLVILLNVINSISINVKIAEVQQLVILRVFTLLKIVCA